MWMALWSWTTLGINHFDRQVHPNPQTFILNLPGLPCSHFFPMILIFPFFVVSLTQFPTAIGMAMPWHTDVLHILPLLPFIAMFQSRSDQFIGLVRREWPRHPRAISLRTLRRNALPWCVSTNQANQRIRQPISQLMIQTINQPIENPNQATN